MNGYIPCFAEMLRILLNSLIIQIYDMIIATEKYRCESYILFEQEVDLDFLLFVFRIMMKKKKEQSGSIMMNFVNRKKKI